jgi:2,4-didehydro-3-deoxy-L-rhamnonate hydrolase
LKLIRFGEAGRERPGVLLDDGFRLDVSDFVSAYDETFFARGGMEALRGWLKTHLSLAPRVPSTIRLGPPICRPSKIVCIGLNYRDHAAETGAAIPKEPVIFFKATTSLVGPNDELVIPRNAAKVDWEVELAFVIGKPALYVPTDKALDYVAGYVLHNDYSERSFQLERGGQWVKGKSADTFAPLGPFLASPDELRDPSNLEMWLKVNGEIRQKQFHGQYDFRSCDAPVVRERIHDVASRRRHQHRHARRGWARNEAAAVSQIWRCCRVGD